MSYNNLRTVFDALEIIAETPGRLDKERMIDTYLKAIGESFRKTLIFALHPYTRFNTTRVDYLPGSLLKARDPEEIFTALTILSKQKAATNTEIAGLSRLASVDKESVEVVRRIVNKDLRCGIGIKTARKFVDIPLHEVMLCEKDLDKFLAQKGDIVWSIKKDGVRCHAIVWSEKVYYLSRNGKEYPNFGVFDEELLAAAERMRSRMGGAIWPLVFDGEVESTDLDFQKAMTQMRRLHNANPEIFRFQVFDIPSYGEHPLSWRLEVLRHELHDGHKVQYLPHTHCSKDQQQILQLLDRALESGEEGLVLKTLDGLYEMKRSRLWCKIKKMHTVDVKVGGWEAGKGKYEGKLGALICDYKGHRVDVGSGFSDEQRVDLLKEMPEMVEVKYQNVTNDGSLRFPIFIRVRDFK